MEKDEKTKWMVCVHCATYNHAPYIEDTMNGFCMQMTNFPYVCVIVDDASTDKEHEVISNYMKEHFEYTDITKEMEETDDFVMTFAQHKVNKNCFFAFHQLKYNHGSIKKPRGPYYTKWDNEAKYIAFCEGDDFWIKPDKLQRQIDFLENNPDFTLIGSNGIIRYTDTQKGLKYFNNVFNTREITFDELVDKWFFPTASLIYRQSILELLPEWRKELHFGDDVRVMTSAIHGKVACLGYCTCVYRKGCGITSYLDKKQVYMHEQHLLFYNHLLEDTGEKYEIPLKNKIMRLEKGLKLYKTKEKSLLLFAIVYPKVFCKSMLKRFYTSIFRK